MDKLFLTSFPVEELEALVKNCVNDCLKQYQPPPTPPEKTDRYLTRREAAKIAGACLATIDNWAREGYIKKYRNGNTVRFKLSNLEAFLEGKKGR